MVNVWRMYGDARLAPTYLSVVKRVEPVCMYNYARIVASGTVQIILEL